MLGGAKKEEKMVGGEEGRKMSFFCWQLKFLLKFLLSRNIKLNKLN